MKILALIIIDQMIDKYLFLGIKKLETPKLYTYLPDYVSMYYV